MSRSPESSLKDNPALSADELLRQTQLIILFIKEEVEHSRDMLRKVADKVTTELCELSGLHGCTDIEVIVYRMTEALQAEDRIQQRLVDIGSALRVLEHFIDSNSYTDSQQLPRTIIEQLRLVEMQSSLAIKANMNDQISLSIPSVGDIDLF